MIAQFSRFQQILLLTISAFLISLCLTAGLKAFDKTIQTPFWLSVNLTEKNEQQIKFYYDIGRGFNETDSAWAWSRNHGLKLSYRSGWQAPSQFRIDFGVIANHTFPIESICARSLLNTICHNGTSINQIIKKGHQLSWLESESQDHPFIISTKGTDAHIIISENFLSSIQKNTQLSTGATLISLFLIIFLTLIFVAFFAKPILIKLYQTLKSLHPITYASGLFCGVVIMACHYFSLWSIMGVHNMPVEGISKTFADWYGVLVASDCHFQGIPVYETNPCDPWDRVHVYGTPWLMLNTIGISSLDVVNTAILINIFFLISCLFIIQPKTIFSGIYSCAIILSPAILLGFERTNADLLLFVLIYLAIALAIRCKGHASQILSAIMIAFCTILKIYPAVSIVGVLFAQKNALRLASTLIAFLSFIALWYALSPTELANVLKVSPKPYGDQVFGAGHIFYILQGNEDYRLSLYSGLLVSILIGYFISLKIKIQTTLRDRDCILFFTGLSLFAGTFYLTMNFDYRCIFFVMCLPALFMLFKNADTNSFLSNCLVSTFILSIIATWAEFPLLRHIPHWLLIEQILTWGLMCLLFGICFALLRKIREKDYLISKIFFSILK